MQDIVGAAHGLAGDVQIGEIAFEKLDFRQVGEVLALARDQTVHDAHAFPATNELFGDVRTDEAGSPGYEKLGPELIANLSKKPAAR